ncbi:MAG: multidrug effflux MFS transporter [Rhizobiaceae bacterium]|nr:multidrug effflux MFS transporter [Rhizobiaceae bacterium]MCV0404598.1 multidrug effflux MFS transporter [Rhizobiaceae bacterium]
MNVLSNRDIPPLMSERRVSVIGAIMTAVGPVSMAIFTPAMTEIVHAFGTTEAAVKLTLSLYFAGFAFAQLICGPLSDALGRKPVAFWFMGIYLLGSLVALVAPTIEVLILARFLQGVGAASGIAISRAIVRDLFTHERSARILNLIGIILAAGPAFAPTVGGLTMELANWHAIFLIMTMLGVAIVLVIQFGLTETVARDPSRLRPRAILNSYRMLLGNGYFMGSSLAVAGAVGALYAQATVLPFVLMDRVGLTPSQFGFGMLMQSGMFFIGSLVVRGLLPYRSAYAIVPIGIGFIAAGSVVMAAIHHMLPLTFLSVMGPVALYAFGIAFIMPAMSTAALAPYPLMAGSASALSGFLQMGAGLTGGLAAALIGDPVLALEMVIPGMGLVAVLSWAFWRTRPEPRMASLTRAEISVAGS